MMSASALPADVATSNNNKIIIIGGGLAGLSLSLGLADLGFQVEIVEKQQHFSRTGATFGLAANGQKALEELCPGVVNELKKVGLDLDPPDIATMLGWWNVRDVLLDRVMKKKYGMIHIRNGWLLQDIKDDDKCVKAVFHKQDQDDDDDEDREQLVLEGCMLVGADGVNSAVRSLLGLPSAKNTGVVTWRGRVQVPPLHDNQDAETCNEAYGKEQDAVLYALRPIVESPLKVSFLRLRGPVTYTLFNFNEKLPGTMALVVTIQQEGDGEQTAITKGTSPQVILEENAESDDERNEIRAILEFTDKDGLHSPTLIKVIEPPKEVGAGWGGKGRITILGDAAHGKLFSLFNWVVMA
jgi:2-polyprenyl-6-methoxyphenol hydroxylase-like FAD-dependent oxidoreductase